MRNKNTPYVTNERPIYQPPRKFFESTKLEEVDEQLASLKLEMDGCQKRMQKAELVDKQTEHFQNQRKRMHHFAKKLFRKVKNIDIYSVDYVVLKVGHRRSVNIHRRNVVNEIMKALSLVTDVLTGYAPKSSITALSNQIGVTTFGQKQYGNKDELKPSISRCSRAIKELEEYGLIEVERPVCERTGKNLPAMIRVTELFYDVLLIETEEREKVRFQKMRQAMLQGKLPGDLDEADMELYLKGLVDKHREVLLEERQTFAQLKREKLSLLNMSNTELREKARSDIKRFLIKSVFEKLSLDDYRKLINRRLTMLHKLRANVLMEDTFFNNTNGFWPSFDT